MKDSKFSSKIDNKALADTVFKIIPFSVCNLVAKRGKNGSEATRHKVT